MAGELTQLLQALERGERGALDRAFALVYPELKRVARVQRRRGANDSFSTTALVHEVYLKFAQAGEIAAESRAHFYNVAAVAMHQVLVDRARRRRDQAPARRRA
jgi:DNA-directed RNA polymerase specialized sigma24 family protein